MKKYNFLNIDSSNMIVLKFHMLMLYIYHQTVSKQCFLVVESRYQSYVYFQALKRPFLAKIMFFSENCMIGPLIWYQICNCNHHNFEEILNFQFSKMSAYSWICPGELKHVNGLKPLQENCFPHQIFSYQQGNLSFIFFFFLIKVYRLWELILGFCQNFYQFLVYWWKFLFMPGLEIRVHFRLTVC